MGKFEKGKRLLLSKTNTRLLIKSSVHFCSYTFDLQRNQAHVQPFQKTSSDHVWNYVGMMTVALELVDDSILYSICRSIVSNDALQIPLIIFVCIIIHFSER